MSTIKTIALWDPTGERTSDRLHVPPEQRAA